MKFGSELQKLGLTDKEAAVYLASLELGPSPVQRIARKARVVRATTYMVIESLMERGLMTKYKEGKKTMFSAEPPRQLLRLLEKEVDVIEDKKDELGALLPELQVLMKAAGDQPTVRYFSGREGLHAMRQEIMMYTRPGDTVLNFTPSDHLNAVFPENESVHYRQRIARKIKSRTIFTTKSPTLKTLLFSRDHLQFSERRYVPPHLFPVASGLSVYRDRIAMGAFTGTLGGVVIESQAMADMMRCLFELAWRGAEPLQEEKS